MTTTTALAQPLSFEELAEQVNDNGFIVALVNVSAHYVKVFRPTDDASQDTIEDLNDEVSRKITGDPTGLTDIDWRVVATVGEVESLQVTLEVTAKVEFDVLDDSNDAEILRQLGMDEAADDLDEHLGGSF